MALRPSDGYNPGMSSHSVAEAKNRFSELIDLALKGEQVVITRHGQPVIEFRPVQPSPGPVTPEALAWLERHRIRPSKPQAEDSGTFVSRMRDEDWR